MDPNRPGRIEMINPEYEFLAAGEADSTESRGRIVPIYEAIWRHAARASCAGLFIWRWKSLPARCPIPSLGRSYTQYNFHRGATPFILCIFRRQQIGQCAECISFSGAPTFNFQQLFLLSAECRHAPASSGKAARDCVSRTRAARYREALKRVLPFKPTDAQKRVLAEIAADLERPVPMNRLLQGDVGSGKTIVAFETGTIVMENGYQTALMAPTEILAVQHYLAAKKILARAGYAVELLISGMKPAEKRAALERIGSGARPNSLWERTRCSNRKFSLRASDW